MSLLQKIARAGVVFAITLTTLLPAVTPVFAWSGPQVGPPGCTSGNPGCDAPVNISATAQTKGGPLNLSIPSGYANWGIQVSGGQYGGYFNGTSYGVQGIGSSQDGVYGQSYSAIGVQGINTGNQNWGGYFTGGYGVYAANSAGYYGELANSSWSLYGNGNAYVNDVLLASTGHWLSSTAYSPYPYGAGFSQLVGGGCIDPNVLAGYTCGCPGYAPTAMGFSSASNNYGAYNSYLCY
jgi:hypothetical protein